MHPASVLVEKGLLKEEQFRAALQETERTRERLIPLLVRYSGCSERDVCRALSERLRIPFLDLDEAAIQPEALDKVPLKTVFERKLVPVSNGDSLVVAVSDPFDLNALDELRLLSGRPVRAVLACPSEIDRAIKKFFGVGGGEIDQMMSLQEAEAELEAKSVRHDLEMAEDASLIKFVNQLLAEAVRERASDIHIEPMEEELRIRYRVDGVLHRVPVPAHLKRFQNAIVARIKIMSQLDIAEKRIPQDGRIPLRVSGREVDVRVSIIPSIFGEGVCLRLLDQERLLFRLEDLGMPEDIREKFSQVMAEPHGMILVTGPTGSGKTTTLYAALQKINSEADKIITVEDPVEYRLPGVKQIQVNEKAGLTFANGLRSILRHDPDIILVGEIRDLETAEIAVQATLTGHLVFTTLHTNDAPSAVTRLTDMGVEPFLVASTVEACLAQRLVRRICSGCRRLDPDRARFASVLPKEIETIQRGAGCQACRGTGYRGRIGLYELMLMDDEIREMVVRKESSARLKKAAIARGMKTLREQGWSLVREGVTTVEEVLRITKEDRF